MWRLGVEDLSHMYAVSFTMLWSAFGESATVSAGLAGYTEGVWTWIFKLLRECNLLFLELSSYRWLWLSRLLWQWVFRKKAFLVFSYHLCSCLHNMAKSCFHRLLHILDNTTGHSRTLDEYRNVTIICVYHVFCVWSLSMFWSSCTCFSFWVFSSLFQFLFVFICSLSDLHLTFLSFCLC